MDATLKYKRQRLTTSAECGKNGSGSEQVERFPYRVYFKVVNDECGYARSITSLGRTVVGSTGSSREPDRPAGSVSHHSTNTLPVQTAPVAFAIR